MFAADDGAFLNGMMTIRPTAVFSFKWKTHHSSEKRRIARFFTQ